MKLDKRIREFPVPLPAAPNTAMAEGDSDVEKGQDDYARAMAEFMPKFYKLAGAFLFPFLMKEHRNYWPCRQRQRQCQSMKADGLIGSA